MINYKSRARIIIIVIVRITYYKYSYSSGSSIRSTLNISVNFTHNKFNYLSEIK